MARPWTSLRYVATSEEEGDGEGEVCDASATRLFGEFAKAAREGRVPPRAAEVLASSTPLHRVMKDIRDDGRLKKRARALNPANDGRLLRTVLNGSSSKYFSAATLSDNSPPFVAVGNKASKPFRRRGGRVKRVAEPSDVDESSQNGLGDFCSSHEESEDYETTTSQSSPSTVASPPQRIRRPMRTKRLVVAVTSSSSSSSSSCESVGGVKVEDVVSVASSSSLQRGSIESGSDLNVESPSDEDSADSLGARRNGESGATVEDLLVRCETISHKLRDILASGGGFAAGLVHTAEMMEALLRADSTGASDSDEDSVREVAAALSLKSYQLAGVNWLMVLNHAGVNAILADEMGLGKTIQILAFLRALRAHRHSDNGARRPHLVVAPASTLQNWRREALKWLHRDSRVIMYHGAQTERRAMRRAHSGGRGVDLILTTYSYFEKDSSRDDRSFLYSIRFDVAVFDEAHALKDRRSSRYRRLRALRARRCVMLSGTPLQNNLSELFALTTFTLPDVFRSLEIKEELFGEEADTSRLRRALAPFVLRRLKAQVLPFLASKVENTMRLQMTPSQAAVYASVAAATPAANARSKPSDGRPSSATSSAIAASFTQLRKAANHALLVRQRFADPNVMDRVARAMLRAKVFGGAPGLAAVRAEIETWSDWDINRAIVENSLDGLDDIRLPDDAVWDSCKARALRELLPASIAAGDRFLIFSQWTTILDVLEEVLRRLGLDFLRLDGGTPVPERQVLVDAFNARDSRVKVFLLSTRAGGLGLNLTAANVVVLHDLDFNPAVDAQAADRAHRIGQTKEVRVVRLVTQYSVDEIIDEVQRRKTTLNSEVLLELPNVLLPTVPDVARVAEDERPCSELSCDSVREEIERVMAEAVAAAGRAHAKVEIGPS